MSELFKDLFIFEMANNHEGRLDHGLRIIQGVAKIARKHGLRAGVKMQYRHLDTFLHPDVVHRPDAPHVPRFLRTRLKDDEHLQLVRAIREEGLISICTPFDEYSVGLVMDHGIQILKVASCSATDWPLLERIAQANRPVICSTGGKSLCDIDNVVSFLAHREVDFALMHCVALYPMSNDEAHLNLIDRFRSRYPYVPIGYSGHEAPDNTDIGKVAAAKGTSILERHVGMEAEGVTLNRYSMNLEQAEAWVIAVQEARRICGHSDGEKLVHQREVESLQSLMRGAYARRMITKGETIRRDAVFFAMPCQDGRTSSGEYQETMVASRDYVPGEALQEMRAPTTVNLIRTIIHDVKGLLYEAKIDLGRDFVIELSHHHGIGHFRNTGAILFNVVNREYCKKVLVMLPGQQHPVHYHKLKEETFHVLWGDLEVELNGVKAALKRGDKLLIERGAKHAFASRNGAIFEEISTAHILRDSYYDDPFISRKDPIERKTFLETW